MTPISKFVLDGRTFYVKRDDLYSKHLSGNKYRKLHKLLKTPSDKIQKVLSYGGTQSNAMLAIAALCDIKKWEFIYYTKPLSDSQKIETNGNYNEAIKLGMKHIEVPNNLYRDYISSLSVNLDEKTLLINQGGADKSAKDGVEVLAQEIRESNLESKSIATPSGTGTTALYLALALPEYKVYTVACVGDSKYLIEQMSSLEEIPANLIILEPKRKYHFGKPHREFIDIYNNLLEAGIEFDLLYAPSMWLSLLEHTDEEVIYVHSGGVTGNESMLQRYKNKGFVTDN